MSIFKQIGASNHCKDQREANDYYATNPLTIPPLLKQLAVDNIILKNIWENCSGGGHIANELSKDYKVLKTDLIKREKDTIQLDFLYSDFNKADILELFNVNSFDIITNPPYKFASEWLEKSIDCLNNGRFLIMLLKITFLEGQARRKIFNRLPPKFVYVFSKRQECLKNGKFSANNGANNSAICYAWFVWEKGCKKDTILKWI